MSEPRVAEHWFLIRFYGQPPEKIAECFESLRLVASGLVHYATRPLLPDDVEGRYVGANDKQCMLMFDSARSLEAFTADPRTKEIYSWFASPECRLRCD